MPTGIARQFAATAVTKEVGLTFSKAGFAWRSLVNDLVT